MLFEHWMLAGAALLGLVHVGAASFTFKSEFGNTYSAGPRDEGRQPTGMAGRMSRAQRNFLETFPIFVACVYLVDATGSSGALSQWGAGLYLGFRILYLPVYASGVPWVRSIVWNVATTGLLLVGVQAVWTVLAR